MQYKNPVSVLVVVYQASSKKVLMLQRNDDPSFWQSVTGTMETGEMPEQTAKREVTEELGWSIEKWGLKLINCHAQVSFEIFPQFRHRYAPEVTHCVEHWFLLSIEENLQPQLSEHQTYQWLPPQEAISLTKSWNNALAIEKYLLN